MKKNILVIGGTGFIGSEIISQLIKIDEYNTYSFGHKKMILVILLSETSKKLKP